MTGASVHIYPVTPDRWPDMARLYSKHAALPTTAGAWSTAHQIIPGSRTIRSVTAWRGW